MRVIHNASLIILVIDIFRKIPLNEVEILCNGVQNPYLKKDSGYYIFSDLQPGKYKIEIFSSGFVKKEINCTLNFGECKKLVFEISFRSNNPTISRLPRIELLIKDKNKNEILPNNDSKIIMKTPINFLKLINNAKKSSMEIILNVENIHDLHFQNYIYEFTDKCSNDEKDSDEDKEKNEHSSENDNEKEESSDEEIEDLDEDNKDKKSSDEKQKNDDNNKKSAKSENVKISEELFFLGYDLEYNAYILLNELERDLKVGGQFFPFWNLSSDDRGKIIIPIFPKFMNKSFFKLEIKVNNASKVIKIDTSKFNKNNVISRKISLEF